MIAVWYEIEPGDVGQLLDKVLVAAELEGLEQMWFKAVLLPDALHRGLAQPLGAAHAAGAPVSCLGRGRVQGRLHHGAYFLRRYGGLASWTGSILFKSGQPQGQKTLSPELDRRPRHSQNLGNVLIRNPIGSHGNDLGSHHLAIRQVPASHPVSKVWRSSTVRMTGFVLLMSNSIAERISFVKLFMIHYAS